MPEPERPGALLGRLIEASVDPPASAPLTAPRAALRRLLLRLSGPSTRHQQQINRLLREENAHQREENARLRDELRAVRTELTALAEDVGGQREWFATVAAEVGGMREWLGSTAETAGNVDAQLRAVSEAMQTAIAELWGRIPTATQLDGSDAFRLERFDAGLGGEVIGFRGGRDSRPEDVYRGFEDYFRGSETVVRGRQQAYLPLLSGRAPVLDVGCGRGELLELLRERGVEAEGVDLDPGMVDRCRELGLQVTLADAAEDLESRSPGTLGAVFAAQVIEHLPYPVLLRVLRAARLAIGAGGALIVETVNPHSPQALKHFWIDPTHQHPLFPETVLALCRLTGFDRAFVWHPQGSGDPDRDRLERPDYAVVAEVA